MHTINPAVVVRGKQQAGNSSLSAYHSPSIVIKRLLYYKKVPTYLSIVVLLL